MRHSVSHGSHGHFFAGRFRKGPEFGGFRGAGGPGGMGGFFRAGKMLADGDLRLIALALLAEAPRHGYEIIKALEQRSSGMYSPSPGVVYPALTFLEEAGYATAATEGNKKVYAITETGRQHLEQNRDVVDTALTQIEKIGKKMAQARDWFDGLRARGETMPGAEPTTGPAADLHDANRALRRALAELEGASDERLAKAAQILQRAAADIRQSD